MALGLGRAALEASIKYAQERQAFGKPIADFQAIQWMIADCSVELEAARLLVMQAAYLKDTKQSFSQQAAMAKLYASEAADRAFARCRRPRLRRMAVAEYPPARRSGLAARLVWPSGQGVPMLSGPPRAWRQGTAS